MYYRTLDRAVRWNCLLHFTNLNQDQVIAAVVGSDISVDSPLYQRLPTKFMDNTRTFKNKTLDAIEVSTVEYLAVRLDNLLIWYLQAHIETLMADNPLLASADENAFRQHMTTTFNAHNFLSCWYYMKDYLDVGKSAELGK